MITKLVLNTATISSENLRMGQVALTAILWYCMYKHRRSRN